MLTASEGAICSALIEMYNEDGIIAEPAGILAVTGLYQMDIDLTGKTMVCIVSGGNNDIYRIQEIIERAKLYEGTKNSIYAQKFLRYQGVLLPSYPLLKRNTKDLYPLVDTATQKPLMAIRVPC